MRTLIFFGSPRSNGNTRHLLDTCLDQLEGEHMIVDCCHTAIAACTDCRWCRHHAGCSIRDSMDAVYPWVEEADAVIIASPVHMGTLSGPLLSVLSRLQTYWSSKFIRTSEKVPPRKKAGALLLTAGSTDSRMEASAEYAAAFAFKLLNADVVGSVLALDTDHRDTMSQPKILQKTREIGTALKQWKPLL